MPLPPLPRAALLHHELDDFVASIGCRRSVPPQVYVGQLGAERVRIEVVGDLDAGLRADLVERALDGLLTTTDALLWITRTGDLTAQDGDLGWRAAAAEAYGRHGLPAPACYLLTRRGWLDLLTLQQITFHRIRRR